MSDRDRQGWPRRASALAALVVAALMATSCGGGPSSPALGSAPFSTAPGVSAGSAGSSSSAGSDSGSDSGSGFAWAPFGPTDPGDPPPNRWYGPLEVHDCTAMAKALTAEPGGALWQALEAVCQAAVDGDRSKWATAAADIKNIAADSGDEGSTGCLADAAKAMLTRAMAWHAAHPEATPVITYPKAGQRTACPFRITSIVVVDAQGQPVGGPLEGPPSGGTLLAIHGLGLTHQPVVLIAGHPATISTTTSVDGAVVVVTPPVTRPLLARIRVGNEAGQLLAPVDFRYTFSSTGNAT